MHPPKVLVVDDDAVQRRMLRRLLSEQGFELAEASSAGSALPLIKSFEPRVLLLDINMPEMTGIEFMEKFRSKTAPLPPTVLMTGLRVPRAMAEASAQWVGAKHLYIKSEDVSELIGMVKSLCASAPEAAAARELRRGKLIADLDTLKVRFGHTHVPLHGRRTFDLLCALLSSDVPLTREVLHRQIWADSDNPGVVNVNVMRLRQALAAFPSVRLLAGSSGYRLVVE